MGRSTLPRSVEELISTHLDSIEALRVLLRLHAAPGETWTARAVAEATSMDEVSATRHLVSLRQRGFLAVEMADDAAYRYAAAGTQAASVDELAACFESRPMDVAETIAQRPQRDLRLFADAFRLRRRKD
jgi:hypothetical protein